MVIVGIQKDRADGLGWCEVVVQEPSVSVVPSSDWRNRIIATGLPWHVRARGSGIVMLLVPPGMFVMGKSLGDKDAEAAECPAHEVTISRPFYLGKTQVTQQEWVRLMGSNPSRHTADGILATKAEDTSSGRTKTELGEAHSSIVNRPLPVDGVSWDRAQTFLQKAALRLPSEAEWEYSCRGGLRKPRYGELHDVAWYSGNSRKRTHSTGTKHANPLGFHDMLGNVWEWCADYYDEREYSRRAAGVTDPAGPARGKERVIRGGSWDYSAADCRTSARSKLEPEPIIPSVGIRVARSI